MVSQKTLAKLSFREAMGGPSRLEVLRQKINDEDYLHEAIQRIALIMSNELLDLHQGGRSYEQQRKSRQWSRK